MLLDTMCNLLGAIIFIALVVALLGRNALDHHPAPPPDPAKAAASLAALIASNDVAEADLQKTLQRLQNPHQHPVTNVMHLLTTVQDTNPSWNVVMRYGKIYPYKTISADGTGISPNVRAFSFSPDRKIIEPEPGKGEDPEQYMANTLNAFRSSGRTNYHFLFLVVADSFAEFRRARDAAANQGFHCAWQPRLIDERLGVGTNGDVALPQN